MAVILLVCVANVPGPSFSKRGTFRVSPFPKRG